MKTLAPKLLTALGLLSAIYISPGCVKNNPEPKPPVDSTQTVDLKKGLLVYLPFSGNYADSSGNNNPTQLIGDGGGLTSDVQNSANSAFGGSGIGGRIEVTNNGSIKFDTAFTVSVNVMEHSYLARQVFASMVKVEDGKGPSFLVGNSIPGASNVWFGVVGSAGTCDDYGNGTSAVDTTNFTPQPEIWYNVICTFSKGVLRTYLNGKLISEKTTTDPYAHVCPNAKFVVGGWWQNDPISINGKLDEVRLYNRALGAAEIAKLAQGFSEVPPTTGADLHKGLLLYLPFNGSIADSSGNNNPTQLVGGAALTNDEHGYANSAFGDDGTGGRLIVTNNGSIKFDTAFSISMSFMERDNSSRQTLISLVNTATGKGVTFGMGNPLPGTREMVFGVASNLLTCDDWAQPSNTTNDTSHNFIPQAESWYNVVCTYHSGTLETYINGVLTGRKSGPYTSASICPDSKVVVGGWWDSDPTSINGKIDNVRLYNRVLLPEEVVMLAQHFQPTTNSIRQTISH